MATTVSIVEDSDQVRNTLARLINRAEGFSCLSQYPSAEAALEDPRKINEQIVRRSAIAPEIQVIMLTVYEDTENIFNALAAGATGYLLKRTSTQELLAAIKDVLRGGSPMTTHIARKVVQSFQKAGAAPQPIENNLSPREQEVLDYLAKGFLYKEIAENLGISYETVHTYIRRIYEKLQVRTRTEAVAKFLSR